MILRKTRQILSFQKFIWLLLGEKERQVERNVAKYSSNLMKNTQGKFFENITQEKPTYL